MTTIHMRKLWYNVVNCGDGSAYPQFFDTEELAYIHAELEQYWDGWGEDCVGCVTVTSDSPIRCGDVKDIHDLIKECDDHLEYASSGEENHIAPILERLRKMADDN